MEHGRPLRLITASPLEALARTLEALLVVASAPLPLSELAAAANDAEERVEAALELVGERFREGRSGIVLERVAGGYASGPRGTRRRRVRGWSSARSSGGFPRRHSRRSAVVAYLGRCRDRTWLGSGALPPTRWSRVSSNEVFYRGRT